MVGFGGPESAAEVMPFLENVARGRDIPRQRLLAVAENYYRLGGRSPINDQYRALIAALGAELETHGVKLPIYLGNRNWHPLLAETMRRMTADGVRRALIFVTSAYSSYSACRQYLEDVETARMEIGEGAPEFERLPRYCLLAGFVEPLMERVRDARARVPEERRGAARLLCTAHSIPLEMAQTSKYLEQLTEVARRVAAGAGFSAHRLVFQSRSGPPAQPWLEPDVREALSRGGGGGREGRGCRADRLHLGPYGSRVRPGYAGPRARREVGAEPGAGGDGGHASEIRGDDPGADRGTPERGRGGLDVALPGELLPGAAPHGPAAGAAGLRVRGLKARGLLSPW